ncbi:broad specificity phosphatase PhoE [Winogradskyella epiphytica]|uniref:Broad specificity phosphatase PhoE n=1 Tax=Winogradskyella epiphytica TaxID=262005 RepID=A0A2V4XEL5_9FLAO|nr:phosphoglycerate mutase family protein [Winogradskyella epiphytica]PYE81485.1 broad specificity phosphatase PhoE [Winogradskyella epiphytica]GGW64827.1 hypothetical protein GCM10008085_16070 [Winogradskyella epiphytica]
MKNLIVILLFSLVAFPSCAQKSTKNENKVTLTPTTTYYLIRHAEKDRSDKSNPNPDLKQEGLQRAENWAEHFKEVNFDLIYSTNYNRTIQTATPTAKANNLEIEIYNPSDLNIDEFRNKTKGKTVLIVGHSNTTPRFVNDLLGDEKYDNIADDNNANLYIVTITNDNISSEVLEIN